MFTSAGRDARSEGVPPRARDLQPAPRTGAVIAALAVLAAGTSIAFPPPAEAAPPCSQSPILGCVPDIPTLPLPTQPPVVVDQAPPAVQDDCYEFSCDQGSAPPVQKPRLVSPVVTPDVAIPPPGEFDRVPVPRDLPPISLPPLAPPTLIPPPPPPPPTLVPPPPPTLPPPVYIPPPTYEPPPPALPPPPMLPTLPVAAPPAPAVPTPAALELSDSTIGPGGDVTATGRGCESHGPVSLSIADAPVGHTAAGPSGGFQAPLTTGSLAVGRHQVTAECGRTLTAPLDIVLVSRVGTGTSTMTVILILLLLGGWFYGHRLASHQPVRGNHDE